MAITNVSDIQTRIKELEGSIANAQDLIKIARDAGEDTLVLQGKLDAQKIRLKKWQDSLARNVK